MIPSIKHATELNPCMHRGTERYYVTLQLSAYKSGEVNVTGTMNDGIFNEGDIMVHIPSVAFVADSRDMKIII